MKTCSDIMNRDYDIGALSTFIPEWYQRYGWEAWKGDLWLMKEGKRIRTDETNPGRS